MNSQQQPFGRRRHRPNCKCDCDRQALTDAGVLDRPELRTAAVSRDIAAIYRLLHRYGLSQHRIAGLTGQSQSEVNEILKGRQVVSYDVLLRIADGLGVPRGWLGLAYDTPDGEPPKQ
jgi:antitoxin component HigA of HigAB toxin-antitoxin module